ncbi:MAG TPA: HAMP domain-containing sensor histidine kinase [Iamia sp.]|nr:HAMP domain-containing sensor histidine kinase [Iamia sp.]
MRRPRAPRLPNRWRITGWITGSVLLVTVVVGILAVVQVKGRFTAELDEELRKQADSLTSALDVIDDQQLEQIAEQPGFGDATYGIAVVRADGEVLDVPSGSPGERDAVLDLSPAAVSRLRGRAAEPFDLPSADGSTIYRALVAQTDDGGLVVVTRSLDDREEAVRSVVGVLLLAGAVAAVVISISVAAVSGWVTRPLDAMIDAAEAIGEGDLTSRVPTDGVEDVARLATALNGMLDRLERAFADKDASEDALRRFVADASHELRTPLAAVLGYAELHQSGMAPSPEQVDTAMARIHAEGERMRLIVEELLTLARLDEGRPMEHLDVDLVEIARLAVADAGAIEPGRPLDLDVPDEPVVVSGDVMSLRQAVDNLLANARTHTPVDTPVRVVVDRVDGHAVVRVADEGPGMDAEVAAHVFDRFYRADRSRARPGGSGLGLAIVAAIAEGHGGTATVVSTPGAGSTFTLSIPTPP